MNKKLISLLLCLLICICFTACGKQKAPVEEGETDTTSVISEESESSEATATEESEAEIENSASTKTTDIKRKAFGEFTMKQLCESNKVSALLKNYETVSYTERNADDRIFEEGCYFSYDGHSVSAEHLPDDEEYQYYFTFDDYSIVKENGKYVSKVYAGPEEEEEMSYDLDYDIVTRFDMGGDLIYDLTESGDYYTFRIGYDGEKSYEDPSCKVLKYDLSIREVTVNQGSDSQFVSLFRYDDPAEDYGFTKGWDTHKLRNVTVIQELSVNGEIANGFMTVIVPYNVEVRPYSYGDYALWGNGESTKEYKYPGEDCDYTVYYTNIMG